MATWSALAELHHPGDSIRERRTELGWTQAELSERTGIPQADISRIENGRLDARWSTIHRIATALATGDQPHRRSLGNGGKVGDVPDTPRARWQPKRRTTLPFSANNESLD
jgi:transcriptional regulator with XRE-family HTH domain